MTTGGTSYYTNDGRRVDTGNHDTEKDLTKNHFNWGNFNAALDWTYILSPKFFANITGVYTYSLSKLRSLEDDRVTDTNGKESSRQFTEHGYHSTINDVGYRMAFDYRPTPRHHIRFGHDKGQFKKPSRRHGAERLCRGRDDTQQPLESQRRHEHGALPCSG